MKDISVDFCNSYSIPPTTQHPSHEPQVIGNNKIEDTRSVSLSLFYEQVRLSRATLDFHVKVFPKLISFECKRIGHLNFGPKMILGQKKIQIEEK